MRRLRCWTGAVFAALYGALFLALYVEYLARAGSWFADLPLTLAALPFTLLMRALNGGTFDFGGELTLRVLAAGIFGCLLAYGVGWLLEAAAGAIGRAVRGRPRTSIGD
jgi:hypothetical protein